MTVGSGLCAQLGYVEETTVGTAVTVTKFAPFKSFKPTQGPKTATSEGLRACAKAITDDRTVVVGRMASAESETEILNKGFGALLKSLIGGAPSATQIGTTTVYRQINTVLDMTGKALTVQAGFPESYGSATVRPYTYRGGKVTQWELTCSSDSGLVALRQTWDFFDYTNGTALATASYPSGVEPFRWGGDGSTTYFQALIGGTVTTSAGRTTVASNSAIKGLRGVSLKGTNSLRTDRDLAGGAGIKSEQLENGWRAYTVDLDCEFADRTQLQDLVDAYTSVALQFEWKTSTAINGQYPTLRVTYPIVKLTGSPDISGPDLLSGKVTAAAYLDNTGTHPLMQIEYESTDSSV